MNASRIFAGSCVRLVVELLSETFLGCNALNASPRAILTTASETRKDLVYYQ